MFAFNDQMAMGVYQEISLNPMISIPHEVSVIGVDNLVLIADALKPGLTTIALPHAEMGRRAVELAAALPLQTPLTPGDDGSEVIRLPGILIERGSVSRIL